MAEPARPSVRDALVKLADHGIEAAEAYDRADLAPRLGELRAAAREPYVRVLVAGEFKQGKSSLVNALVGHDVCPVDDDVATSVATSVRFAADPVATALTAGADEADEPVRQAVDPADLAAWVTESAEPGAPRPQLVEVGVPADALRGGLELVDVPGAGGLGSLHGAATLAALGQASAVVFVSDAVQELTATEQAFLEAVAERCPTMALVKTKVDIHPAWRTILERDRANVGEAVAHVAGVSALLARKGVESADVDLQQESGVPDLAAWLRDDVVTGAGSRLAAVVADEVVDVCRQLRAPFDAERAALDDPGRRAEVEARLEAAKAESERLRAAASRWQQVLTDAFTDIGADAEHNLRLRVRDLLRRSEEAIDGFDPADAWEEYEPVLRREVATLVADHNAEIHERVAEAARRVTEVFAEDAAGIGELLGGPRAADGTELSSSVALATPGDASTSKRLGLGGQAFALARGSYGPSLMFGFLGGIAGITLAAPALLAVGLVAGGKGLRTEKERRLATRRTQAKASARKFVDEVVLHVGKSARDEIRRDQRVLRAHFVARAEELVRSATAAVAAAQRSTAEGEAAKARRADLDAEIERIEWLEDLAVRVRAAVQPQAA